LLQEEILSFHRWTFSCPTQPLAIFLDCRTNRKYDSLNGPPQLVDEEELESFFDVAVKAEYKRGDPVLVVVPTPVFGFDWIERIQRIVARVYDIYKADLEVWSANKAGLARFFTFIAENLNPKFCILFSGDVHYGFTKTGNFSLQPKNNGDTIIMNVIQLTSSALKTTSISKKVILGAILGHIREFFSPKTSISSGTLDHPTRKKATQSSLLSSPTASSSTTRSSSTSSSLPTSHAADRWTATSSIKRMENSKFLSLLVADNNLGSVQIKLKEGTVIHDLLVRNVHGKIKDNEAKVNLK
jgi:hypothetical protein